jgi:hypothetical protein
MSELIITQERRDFRWQLLTTASALTLLTMAAATGMAKAADDEDRPTVWVELGGQLERVEAGQEKLDPLFIQNSIRAPVWQTGPLDVQRSPRYSFGGEAKLLFAPAGSDWVISAGVRYGRNNGKKEAQQQTAPPTLVPASGLGGVVVNGVSVHGLVPALLKPANLFKNDQKSSYAIADFQAGKDVGLGLFGGHSVLEAGIRFAQFSSQSNTSLQSRPTVGAIKVKSVFGLFNQAYYYPHVYGATASAERSFRGVGPSLSLEGSSPVIGHPERAQILFDWGVDAAVLFGRQKARTQHATHASHFTQTRSTKYNKHIDYQTGTAANRARSVVVPNVGGFAGLSLSFPNAKVSLGYRAEIFFGAMDGGMDARKTSDQTFYGPFATISVGL